MTEEEFWDYIVAYCRTKRATIDELDALGNSEAAEELKSLATDDCQIWHFRSSKDTWNRLAGRAGFVILRKGEFVGGTVTLLS